MYFVAVNNMTFESFFYHQKSVTETIVYISLVNMVLNL